MIIRYDSDNYGELVIVSVLKFFVVFDVDIFIGDIFGILLEDLKVRN